MQNNYGWYGEVVYDYEEPDPPSQYDRICGAIYRKGWNSEVGATCPYKRADYVAIWHQGASDAYEANPANAAAIKEWYDAEVAWMDEPDPDYIPDWKLQQNWKL